MSKVSISICDLCKAEEKLQYPTNGRYWYIKVIAEREYDPSPYTTANHVSGKSSIHVCPKCLMQLGFNVTEEIKKQPEYKSPTIEDVIREIVREEIDNK